MKLNLTTIAGIAVYLIPGLCLAEPPRPGEIPAEALEEQVIYLGSDQLMGRAPGTEGIDKAAEFISGKLEDYGLIPIGDRGGFLQRIPMHGSRPLSASELKLVYGDTVIFPVLHEDYLLYKSGAQTYIPTPVPVVFAGYGIIAPEYDYNDYQNVDVEGKIVVYLKGEPPSEDPHFFNGSAPTIYQYPESKMRIAISRGAIGSILISNPADGSDDSWELVKRQFSFEDVTLAYRVTGHLSLLFRPGYETTLFSAAPYSYDECVAMIKKNTITAFELGVRLSFRGRFREREFISSNIAGLLPGDGTVRKDRYILLSAHYDHLGVGEAVCGDSIYNGVLDNAIGTAGLLELARVFSAPGVRLKRSLLFVFLTAEEKGLLGSEYYVDHPLVPLYQTVANINIDGLGFIDTFDDLVPVGAELSGLKKFLDEFARENGLKISPVPSQFSMEESFSRSDQVSFARSGIPSVLIADGYRYRNLPAEEGLRRLQHWFDTVYHSPFDDLNQPINYRAAAWHVNILANIIYRLANDDQPVDWVSGSPYVNTRLRTIAEQR